MPHQFCWAKTWINYYVYQLGGSKSLTLVSRGYLGYRIDLIIEQLSYMELFYVRKGLQYPSLPQFLAREWSIPPSHHTILCPINLEQDRVEFFTTSTTIAHQLLTAHPRHLATRAPPPADTPLSCLIIQSVFFPTTWPPPTPPPP
jgi:hypothetical protein